MTRMRCRAVRSRLDAWVDARLSEAVRQALEAHLETCAACAREAERLRALVQGLRGAPRPVALRRRPPMELVLADPPRPLAPVLTLRRVAAGLLFLLALGGSHYAVYRAGVRESRPLHLPAPEARAALRSFLERADTHVRFARTLAREGPAALGPLVREDPATRRLRASARRLLALAAAPELAPIRPGLRAYVRALEGVYRAPTARALAAAARRAEALAQRLEEALEDLSPSHPPHLPARAREEDILRAALHALLAERPRRALVLLQNHLRRGPVRHPASFTLLLAEAGARAGALEGGEWIARLIRRSPSAREVFRATLHVHNRRGRAVRVFVRRDPRSVLQVFRVRGGQRLRLVLSTSLGEVELPPAPEILEALVRLPTWKGPVRPR